MKKLYSLFVATSILFPSFVLAKHMCLSDAPLENCSHRQAVCTDISTNLRLGMKGAAVTSLQTYLETHGYIRVEPTGYFGKVTLQGVKDFQKAHGIDQTGFVGPMTRAKLKANSCTTQAANCTEEVRYCSNGSVMPRNTLTCEWKQAECSQTTNNASSSLGAWVNWQTSNASTGTSSMLDNLKKVLQSIGVSVGTFATTTMSEQEILQMTRNFELQYIGK